MDMAIKRIEDISAERLRALLDYCPETGILTRRVRANGRQMSGWRVGTIIGGYLKVMLDGRRYACHRLVWLYVYGVWPCGDLDHINGQKFDNRIANLREATRAENVACGPRRRDNTSGEKGVCFHRATQKWIVQVRNKHVGLFESKANAITASRLARCLEFGVFSGPPTW